MAFRRVIITGEKFKEVESELKRFLELPKTKIDFPDLKTDVKVGIKPNTLIIDLNGEGADSFSKKIKDLGIKFQCQIVIKLEKEMKAKMSEIKNLIKEVLKEEEFSVSPLEMADGNVNIKNLEKAVSLVKGLVNDLLNSGYFEEFDECLDLVYKLIAKQLGSKPFQKTPFGDIGLNESKLTKSELKEKIKEVIISEKKA